MNILLKKIMLKNYFYTASIPEHLKPYRIACGKSVVVSGMVTVGRLYDIEQLTIQIVGNPEIKGYLDGLPIRVTSLIKV